MSVVVDEPCVKDAVMKVANHLTDMGKACASFANILIILSQKGGGFSSPDILSALTDKYSEAVRLGKDIQSFAVLLISAYDRCYLAEFDTLDAEYGSSQGGGTLGDAIDGAGDTVCTALDASAEVVEIAVDYAAASMGLDSIAVIRNGLHCVNVDYGSWEGAAKDEFDSIVQAVNALTEAVKTMMSNTESKLQSGVESFMDEDESLAGDLSQL